LSGANSERPALVERCLRHKTAVLVAWFGAALLSLLAIAWHLSGNRPLIDNSVGIWFMDDDPELLAYDKYHKDFGETEWTILLLHTTSIYDPNFLRDLADISARLEHVEHVAKVVSIANVRDSRSDGSGLVEYTRLYPAGDASVLLTAPEVEEFKARLRANPILVNSLYRPGDDRTTAVLFKNDNLIHEASPYRIRMFDAINEIVGQYTSVTGHSMAGSSVINAELNRSSRHDVVVFYVLVSIFIAAAGYALLRTVKDLFVLLVVVTTSAIVPMALIALLAIPYNMVTVMLPPFLITLSVCDVIHVINGFHYERISRPASEAVVVAVNKIWIPCLCTSAITIVGLLSLAASTVHPIRQLGVFAGLGIFVAWLVTMTLAPVLLAMMPCGRKAFVGRPSHTPDGFGRYAPRLLPFLSGGYRWVWLGVAAAMLYMLAGLSQVEVDTDYTKFFGRDTAVTRSYSDIEHAGFGQNPVSIVLRYPEGSTFATGDHVDRLMAFETGIAAVPGIVKLLSLTQIVGRIDMAFNGHHDGSSIAGYSEEQLAQLLLLGELSGNDDVKDFLAGDRRVLQILALTPYMSSRQLVDFKQRIHDAAARTLPHDVDVDITGSAVLWANMDAQISHTEVSSTYIITLVFLLIMPVIFRSARLGVVGFVVNALPLVIVFGLMGLLDVRINMATALIGGVAIGATADSTLFFINAVRRGFRAGMAWPDAVDQAVATVGDGIVMTSLVLAGSFACLATSSFLPTAQFGALVTAAVLLSLFLDIIINPIVLKLVGPPADSLALSVAQREEAL
jgi:predicted RND superfamily exporter protein